MNLKKQIFWLCFDCFQSTEEAQKIFLILGKIGKKCSIWGLDKKGIDYARSLLISRYGMLMP